MDSSSKGDLFEISNGELNLGDVSDPNSLTIRAITIPTIVSGVEFYIDDDLVQTEYCYPYSLASNYGCDADSGYKPASILSEPGVVKITVKPYRNDDTGQKVYGETVEITLTIVAAPTKAPTLPPTEDLIQGGGHIGIP